MVSLGFSEHAYRVSEEEEAVEFCVELSGVINVTEAGIWANTFQADGDAIGKNATLYFAV